MEKNDIKQKHDAFKSAAIGSIIPTLKKFEANQTAYTSAIEDIIPKLNQLEEIRKAAIGSIIPTLKMLESTQETVAQVMANIPMIDYQQSIEPITAKLREATNMIQENEKQQEEFGIRTRELLEAIGRSKRLEKERIGELEKRITDLEKKLEEK